MKISIIEEENDGNIKIEEFNSGDQIKELEKLVQEKDINSFNTIKKSFLEVEEMKIPLVQYCIMKKAIECFKYLLVNSFDDPTKIGLYGYSNILWEYGDY